jgi:isoaspartyl peptidase/L-asparaginase-like protein (Ntn-hydrolase superfamily)
MPTIVMAHGGAEADPEHRDGPQRAADLGLGILHGGGSALDAVVAAVAHLEADERFNAGLGADIRLDGRTIQCDAACLDSAGRLGAVGALEHIVHPIRVARALVETPHVLLVGEGALRYARRIGEKDAWLDTDKAREHFAQLRDRMRARTHEPSECEWDVDALEAAWNYDSSFAGQYRQRADAAGERTTDANTVGAIAWDGSVFAAAASTGGQTAALLGRVADTPLPGCGLEATPNGVIATTGAGEHVARARLATRVVRRLEDGVEPQEALQEALGWVPEHAALGMIILDKRGRHAAGGKKPMPWGIAQSDAPLAREPDAAPARR